MALLAPIPRASAIRAARVVLGVFASVRSPKRMSFQKLLNRISRAPIVPEAAAAYGAGARGRSYRGPAPRRRSVAAQAGTASEIAGGGAASNRSLPRSAVAVPRQSQART